MRHILLVIAVAFAGCGDDDRPACLTGADCAAGQTCLDRRCVTVDAGCAPRGDDDTCDGVDDDCDGIADEAWQGDDRCGLGPCAAAATPARCEAGVETPCRPGAATPETCNALDDDCDGAIDETFDLTQDIARCGACDTPCAPADAVPHCRAGACGIAACADGFVDCDGRVDNGCETVGACPPDGTCDGVDDDRDGETDEDYRPDGTCGVGACQRGATPSRCDDGTETPCAPAEPAATDATCDGVDDDCDGEADEDHIAIEHCGLGTCAVAATPGECVDGVEAPCTPGAANDEICNAADDDCDGITDEGFDLLGDPAHCGRCGAACAPPGGEGICVDGACRLAACRAGFTDCNGDAADGCEVEGACPPEAACDGIDDDGDGRVDEGYQPVERCGEGACAAASTPSRCVGGEVTPCAPGAVQDPTDALCNGIDGDCDGRTDEGYAPLDCGRGACAEAAALSRCEAGVEVACEPGAPSDETCDGRDEDCDGVADEGFALGEPCALGVGLCRRAGRRVCDVDGGATCDAEPGAPLADDACDGLDADCDGRVDEAYVAPDPAGCGAVGACGADARPARCEGGVVAACEPAMPSGERCNAIDDDCDGRYDELPFEGFETIVLPFARQAVGEPRRAALANMAWSGEVLAVVWYEFAPGDYDGEEKHGGVTLLDREGLTISDDARRQLDEATMTPPYVTWSGDAFLAAWTHFGDHQMRSRWVSADARPPAPVERPFGGVNGNLRVVIEGPDGPLMGWYELAGGGSEARFEAYVGAHRTDADLGRVRLTDNAVYDRTPRLAAAPDRVGVVWYRPSAEGRGLWLRTLDGAGEPLSPEIHIGELGPAAPAYDATTYFKRMYDITWTGRGFVVTWVRETPDGWTLHARRVSADGELDSETWSYVRQGRVRSRMLPARWVPALESVALAWSEDIDGRARVFVGLLDPLTGALDRAEPMPPGEGEQLNPTDIEWLGDRLAVVWEERRAANDWRLALGIGSVGCGRGRCVDGPRGGRDIICDGIDDDCDGVLDEDYQPPSSCGIGECRERATPASLCIDGWSRPCQPGTPESELTTRCNGLDDDCDEQIDEGEVVAATTFDAGPDGWTVIDLNGCNPDVVDPREQQRLDWVEDGGVPGGHISVLDGENGRFQFNAPGELLGDRTSLIGGTLRYAIRRSAQETLCRVVLYGADGEWLRHTPDLDPGVHSLDEWHVIDVPITPAAFVARDGESPTPDEFAAILGNLRQLLIPGDYGDGIDDSAQLDSVEWISPLCPPGG